MLRFVEFFFDSDEVRFERFCFGLLLLFKEKLELFLGIAKSLVFWLY